MNYFIFINSFYLFIYFWLRWIFVAALRLSVVVASAVRGLLIVVASLVAEHEL